MSGRRLPDGGAIDRTRPLSFTFDGRTFGGFSGDTLASALIANGVTLVGRSFKYHRPRGIFSAGSEEPNALVECGSGARRDPNTRATTVELFDGLAANSQNCWPSLGFDVGAINQAFAPLLAAGFYYKTFMWPAAFWEKLYEPLIRRAAGLGRLSGEADPDAYEKAHAFCDLLIVGAGPGGLAAALAAGRAGLRVVVAEQDFVLGGRLLAETVEIDDASGVAWTQSVAAELASLPNVRVMTRTVVFAAYDGEFAAIESVTDHLAAPPKTLPRQRLWKIVARETILAAGAIERPVLFENNDRPGVMLASAVRSYVNRFAALPGDRCVIVTCCDDGWRTAGDLRRAGATIAAVIDTRKAVAPAVRAVAGDVPVFLDARCAGVRGGRAVKAVAVVDAAGRAQTIAANLVAVAGGWNPNLSLSTHLGAMPLWSDDLFAFVPGDLPTGMTVIGAAAGHVTTAQALQDGFAAGIATANRAGKTPPSLTLPRTSDEPAGVGAYPLPHADKKVFVDLQNDVTVSDIALATREGFRSAEHLKRYTTLGMATDQGKTSTIPGLAVLAHLTGRSINDTGTTRARPPSVPVAIAAFAGLHTGRHFKPTRRTAGHDWAASNGATFVEAGQWLRAQWFSRAGETDWLQSVTREAAAVRAAVGVCDVSTLGKIALRGRDVGAFLDRLYVNTFSNLPVGKVRYGVMLREDGFVMDDGTTARLADDSYLMTTTTVNAGKVMQHLEFAHQVLWPQCDVRMMSVTEQWAQYAVAGPSSRRLLQTLLGDAIDLSDAAFPYLACAEHCVGGIPLRLFRISFSGELAYEIAAPADCGASLIEQLMRAGRDLDVTPYGTEALSVLRIEKGHVAGGELSGHTVARDLGLGRMMSMKKDYIGRAMAVRPALTDPARPTLVGLRPVDRRARLRNGAHLLPRGVAPSPDADQGYVTSTAFSPACGHWIGLGLLAHGPERIGEFIRAYDPIRNGDVEVEVVAPVFVDPEGARLHA